MDCCCCHHCRARWAWFQQPAPPTSRLLPIFDYPGVTRSQDGDGRLRLLWPSKMLFRNLRVTSRTLRLCFYTVYGCNLASPADEVVRLQEGWRQQGQAQAGQHGERRQRRLAVSQADDRDVGREGGGGGGAPSGGRLGCAGLGFDCIRTALCISSRVGGTGASWTDGLEDRRRRRGRRDVRLVLLHHDLRLMITPDALSFFSSLLVGRSLFGPETTKQSQTAASEFI